LKNISFIFLISILIIGCSEDKSKAITTVEKEKTVQEIEEEQVTPVISELYILPVNHIDTLASLVAFEQQLRLAIKQKDTILFKSLMDTGIVFSHGGGIYTPDQMSLAFYDGYDEMWEKLEHIVDLGGIYYGRDTSYRIPYCDNGSFYTETDGEWYTLGTALRERTPLYEHPDSLSKIKAYLHYSIGNISWESGGIDTNGYFFFTPERSNISGYIHKDNLYRTQDYSLHLKCTNNVWRIKDFAPYD
jgi:hypothetical protein